MKITLSTDALTNVTADLLAVGVRAGKVRKNETVQRLDRSMNGHLAQQIKDEDFSGKQGEVLKVPASGRVKAKWILLVGVGGDEPGAHHSRIVAVHAARAAKRQRTVAIIPVTHNDASAVRMAAEGLVTGSYNYTQYLTGSRRPKGGIRSGTLVVPEKTDTFEAAVEHGRILGEGVNLCRDLVNAPANDLHPPALAEIASQHAEAYGVECEVWDKKRIEREQMNLLLAVNRGSGVEPRFIKMHYKPDHVEGPVPRVAFVGKGITFDSGGLCLKPPKGMVDMKCDMAGAAVTIAVVMAAARMQLPIEVYGIVAATENMTGDFAYRPGDVFPSLDGKTVEIINTDAEGRLALADALAHTRELEPDYVVDHATLTGASVVALGHWTAGLFSNDDTLGELYGGAASEESESFWRMPLTEDLTEGLKSDVADLKHTGEPQGGAITAALFLREFVGKSKWAHVDIAGPAHLDSPHGIHPKGGTGFGVVTAIRFLADLCQKQGSAE
jgi:leucyl aminopeptidase